MEFDFFMRGQSDGPPPEHAIGGDIKFLASFYAENTEEMVCVRPQKPRPVSFYSISDPTAARHTRLSIT